MGLAEAFVEAYALGSTLAALVCLTGLVVVPHIRTRYTAWRGSRRLARFLAEVAAAPATPEAS